MKKNKDNTMLIKFQNKYGKEPGRRAWLDWKKQKEQVQKV